MGLVSRMNRIFTISAFMYACSVVHFICIMSVEGTHYVGLRKVQLPKKS